MFSCASGHWKKSQRHSMTLMTSLFHLGVPVSTDSEPAGTMQSSGSYTLKWNTATSVSVIYCTCVFPAGLSASKNTSLDFVGFIMASMPALFWQKVHTMTRSSWRSYSSKRRMWCYAVLPMIEPGVQWNFMETLSYYNLVHFSLKNENSKSFSHP